VVLYVTRRMNIVIVIVVCSELILHRGCLTSRAGCALCFWTVSSKTRVIRNRPLEFLSQLGIQTPALSLTSSLIFASVLIEQRLYGQAALPLDQLDTPERARPLPFSPRVHAAQGRPGPLRYPAEQQISIHLNQRLRLGCITSPPHSI